MATRKPKVAAKAGPKSAPKKTASDAATKTRAKKAAAPKEAKTKAPAEIVLLEPGQFVKFTGYVNETPEEDQIFQKGDTLYLCAVEEGDADSATMYTCCRAADMEKYIENPEDDSIEGQTVAVQEVAALSGRALAQANDDFAPIPSVGDLDSIIEEADGNLLDAAEMTFGKIEQAFFYLGGVLARIKRENAHLAENGGEFEGENAWDDFCQAKFNFGGAKGGDLARMYTTFAAIPGFEPASLSDIGWSKVREIQRFVTDDNYEELIEDARIMTRDELKTALITKYVDEEGRTPSGAVASRTGGRNAVKQLTMTFKMVEENATAMQLALDEAKKKFGVESDAEALIRIVISWAEEHVESATKQKRIASKVAKAEKAAMASKPRAKAAA